MLTRLGGFVCVCAQQLLTEHGVDRTFHVTAEPPVTDCKQVDRMQHATDDTQHATRNMQHKTDDITIFCD